MQAHNSNGSWLCTGTSGLKSWEVQPSSTALEQTDVLQQLDSAGRHEIPGSEGKFAQGKMVDAVQHLSG